MVSATAALGHDPAADDRLVLVDPLDRVCGSASKSRCHAEGLLHRAFSVVLVRQGQRGWETLLTRRAMEKYHSGGLWTNACCSHPRVGERLADAVVRRLREELGACDASCREVGHFVYRTPFPNGIVEYELDHVWLGSCAGPLKANPNEASAMRWVPYDELMQDLVARPQDFTAWCPQAFALVAESLRLH